MQDKIRENPELPEWIKILKELEKQAEEKIELKKKEIMKKILLEKVTSF
ncbi:hypothetical protein HZA97_02300 [Candidatus Woesearchaeota archaeon]|nr:hypothetical protein [Candidatus Woesearchaeota archaeon]